MIVLYFTKNLKYLQKGDYKKVFDVESIADLLEKIKIKDKVLIKANSQDIFDFKFNSGEKHTDLDIDYEVLNENESVEQPIFDYNMVRQDYRNDDVAYAIYPVAEKWQNVLGKEIYFCKTAEMVRYLVKEKDVCSFLYSDMEKLKNDLQTTGEIGVELVNKFCFTEKEIAEDISYV